MPNAMLKCNAISNETLAFEWMEQRTFKIVNSYLNTNTYSYLETSGGQSSNLYLNVVNFFNISIN